MAFLALLACHKQVVTPVGWGDPTAQGDDDAPPNDELQADDDAALADDATAVDAAADVSPAQKPNVLFIGNSYTYVNDLPAMTVLFAAAGGVKMQQTSVTQGGASLAVMMAQTQAVATIAQGGWTHVVLQGQSLEPAADPTGYLAAAKPLSDDVHKTGAALAFYQTWPRKAGDAIYQEAWTGGTPQTLAKLLQGGVAKAAQENGGVRVPVGDAWMLALTQHPEIALYQADGSHPLVAGTYLTACVFAVTLFGVNGSAVHWAPDGLPAKDATALRAMCRDATSAP